MSFKGRGTVYLAPPLMSFKGRVRGGVNLLKKKSQLMHFFRTVTEPCLLPFSPYTSANSPSVPRSNLLIIHPATARNGRPVLYYFVPTQRQPHLARPKPSVFLSARKKRLSSSKFNYIVVINHSIFLCCLIMALKNNQLSQLDKNRKVRTHYVEK